MCILKLVCQHRRTRSYIRKRIGFPITCQLNVLCSWIVAHSMNTHSMDYTALNKYSPKVLDELSSWLFLAEDFIPV